MAEEYKFDLASGYERELNKFMIKTDELLKNKSLEDEDKKVEIFKLYDLALWRCHPQEVIFRIQAFIIENQKHFISVINRYMQGEHFEVEMDYVYMLLDNFSSDTIDLIKDNWINKILQNQSEGDYFTDMIKIIYRSCKEYGDVLLKILDEEIERILKNSDKTHGEYLKDLQHLKDNMSSNKA